MSLLDKILLNETYVYRGDISLFNNKVRKHKKISKLEENSFEVRAKFSLGVFMSNGLGSSIKTNFKIEESETNKHYIRFSTKLRFEHYLFAILFPVIITRSILSHDSSLISILFILGLWIFCHLWFHFVYRWQEQNLMEEIVKLLSLKKLRPKS